MKNFTFLILMSLSICCFGQVDFIATFKTDNPGTSSNTSITIPIISASGYQVDFNNDGDLIDAGEATLHTIGFTHDFGAIGTYTIRIVGDLDRVLFEDNAANDPEKILSIDQWGTASVWTSFGDSFYGCANLTVPATDAPNLSSCSNMTRMFRKAANFNEPVDHWDVSNITLMTDLFRGCSSFNQALSSWDVSNVIWADFLFGFATNFNQPLNTWNVTNMNFMQNMFRGASSFNQPLNFWNVSGTLHIGAMFRDASSFNQPLNTWDVSGITNIANLFRGATSFDQPLDSWDITSTANLSNMFFNATSFNQPLATWNVSGITNMTSMFRGATSFDQPLNSWNVSSVANMSYMFRDATSFDQSLDSWNIASAPNLSNMFFNATSFNEPLNTWNVSGITNMTSMFRGATSFDQSLNSWNVSSVANMSNMFRDATSFNQEIGVWDISSVANMSNMLMSVGLDCGNYDATLIGWEAQGIIGLTLDATGLNYDNALSAHNLLTSIHGWTITGDNYTSGCSSLLPIELLSFDANLKDNIVYLDWQTASEINNDYFMVQRSKDGITWRNIMEIDGAGNSSTVSFYSAEDIHPVIGRSYYRLKQYDYNGAFFDSPMIAIRYTGFDSFHIYPNPTNGITTITNSSSEEMFDYELMDLTGKVIFTATTANYGPESIDVNLGNYHSGFYLLRVFNENTEEAFFIVKE